MLVYIILRPICHNYVLLLLLYSASFNWSANIQWLAGVKLMIVIVLELSFMCSICFIP